MTAVSRFGDPSTLARFHDAALDTLSCDLLADGALETLPEAANIVYLVGMKFGSTSDPGLTWAMNTFLPGLVARRFKHSRIVALSTGNVYPLVDVRGGGASESDPLQPVGEYAQSCLGRERMFTYSACQYGTPVALVRLNYANALRYGVLVDIAQRVAQAAPVDVTTGHVNVIWQADANAAILQSLRLCATPTGCAECLGPGNGLGALAGGPSGGVAWRAAAHVYRGGVRNRAAQQLRAAVCPVRLSQPAAGAAAGVDRGLDQERPAAAEQANRIPGARRGLLSSQLAGVSHVLRGLLAGDLVAADRLRDQAGWNQAPGDWQRLLAWQPGGCFVAEDPDGQVDGTVTTTPYSGAPSSAWVGMVLVDQSVRRQGLGRALLTRAVEWLEHHDVGMIGLDATPVGKTLYDQTGFADVYTLQRQHAVVPDVVSPAEVTPLGSDDVARLAELDRAAFFGLDRQRILRDLHRAHPSGCWLKQDAHGRVEGYVLSRPGAAGVVRRAIGRTRR